RLRRRRRGGYVQAEPGGQTGPAGEGQDPATTGLRGRRGCAPRGEFAAGVGAVHGAGRTGRADREGGPGPSPAQAEGCHPGGEVLYRRAPSREVTTAANTPDVRVTE